MNLDSNPSLLDSVQGFFFFFVSGFFLFIRVLQSEYMLSPYSTMSLWKAENF